MFPFQRCIQLSRTVPCCCQYIHHHQNMSSYTNGTGLLYKHYAISKTPYRRIFNKNHSQHSNLHFTSFKKKLFSRSLFLSASRLNNNNSSNKNEKTMEVSSNKWLTVPNALTFGRLLISPYIGYLVLCEEFSWALGLVFLASVTDSLDGWIARNFKGQASNIGSYIDPLADKVMISILTVTLTMVNIIPVPLCGMIIARDILLVLTSSHLHWKHIPQPKTMEKFFDFENAVIKMEPTLISKYNTFLQLGLVVFSVSAPVFHFIDHPMLQAYWYLVATTTVLSGLSYVVKDKSAYIIKK